MAENNRLPAVHSAIPLVTRRSLKVGDAPCISDRRDPSPKSGGSDFRGQQEAFGRRTRTRRMIALRAVCLGPSKALSGLAGLGPLELHRAGCYFLLFRFSAI